MIALIDYGMGNLKSVANALGVVGAEVKRTDQPADLRGADGIIIPGVGAFGDGMKNLRERNLLDALRYEVLEKKKPYLGICLGMQFLADTGYESGETPGLGFIAGKVVRLAPVDKERFKIPHMGWNNISTLRSCPLFDGLGPQPVFYFVHSFHFEAEPRYISAICDHGQDVVTTVWKENIFGVQFHPEKSQGMGLKVLENFCQLVARARNA